MPANEDVQLRFDYAPTVGNDSFKSARETHERFDLAAFSESKTDALRQGETGLQEIAAGKTMCQAANAVPEAHNRAPSGMNPNNLCGGLMLSDYLHARRRVEVLERRAKEDAMEIERLRCEVANSKKEPSPPVGSSLDDIAGLRQFCHDQVHSMMSHFFRKIGTRTTKQSASDVSSSDL